MTSTLSTCAMLGSLLLRADDALGGARAVESYFVNPGSESVALLERLGIDVELVRDLRPVLSTDEAGIRAACELGAAWALGRRSVTPLPTWEPVVTSGDITDQGVDRMTAETLIGLVVGARRTVRLFSAFVDRGGLDVLSVSLAAATRRGVQVTVGYARAGDRSAAMKPFKDRLRRSGTGSNLRIVGIGNDLPFPHVKLLAADGVRAYLGSANLTWPALTSNVELGALVSGVHVETLERCFDALIDRPLDTE